MLARIADPVTDTKAVTHLERGVSVRMAEMEGMDPEQLRRAGRWRGHSSMLQSYLTGIPYEFLTQSAGYNGKGTVFVLRNEVTPGRGLISQVFPELDALRAELNLPETERGWTSCPEDTQFVNLLDHLANSSASSRQVLQSKIKYYSDHLLVAEEK